MRRNARGFTLMELMVVIVIVAILAAVAVPLYINYHKDAQRTEAKRAIGAIITAEQTYLQRNGGYTANVANLNVDLADLSGNWNAPAISSIVATPGSESFTVTLSGKGSLAGLSVTCVYTRGQGPVWSEQ